MATYLKGRSDAEMVKKLLVVVPATMKAYWEEELGKWCQDTRIMQFDDKKKDSRYQQMKSLRREGGILITSYGMVTTES